MQIKEIPKLIADLEVYRVKGGKTFKEVNRLLNTDATRYNIEEAQALLKKLAGKT